jgi:hypothetical protein
MAFADKHRKAAYKNWAFVFREGANFPSGNVLCRQSLGFVNTW